MSIFDKFFGLGESSAIRDLDLRPSNLIDGQQYDVNDPTLIPFLRDGRGTSSGAIINEQNAMRNSAFNRAVRLICNSIGMLPIHGYADVGEGEDAVPARQKGHYLDDLLHNKPNPWMTPFEFKSYMVSRALLSKKGVAYALKLYKIGPRGRRIPRALIPLDPARVEAKLNSQWELEFTYSPADGPARKIPWQDMFWFRAPYSRDGVNGVSLIEVAAETLGLSLTAEATAGYVMQHGSISGMVLEHPKSLSENAIKNLRNQFEDRHSGPSKAGKVVIAEEGMKVADGKGGTTMRDAQMIEQRKFQVEETARFTDVPRPLLMMDETSWGSGIEQLGLFFITYCLMPWFVVIEEAVKRSLLNEVDQGQYYAKFNEGALLRGSLKDQAEFFSKALGSGGSPGWMTQDEVREKQDMQPKGGTAAELPTGSQAAAGEGQEGQAPEGTEDE